jgi:hypothetical protein
MAKRLLDRQARLLEYLTSGDAIFRDERAAPLDASLQGIDRALLHIEARFSYEKRMEKIAAVFPKTFDLLGTDRDEIVREFVEACPPIGISRIENACQFLDFLTARWQREPAAPPYLPDVAACELTCSQVRLDAGDGSVEADPTPTSLPSIRRNSCVGLIRAGFDLRPIFEDGRGGADPIKRKTLLAITVHAGEPQIFELTPEVFDLLAALDQWVAVDELANADGLITDLAKSGFLEVRR